MSDCKVKIAWSLDGDFAAGRYSRRHEIAFDGGTALAGSASPEIVPLPWSEAAAADPEELFTASLSACHMLWFLDLARRAGLAIDRYRDEATGTLSETERGRRAMSEVTLRPWVRFVGRQPSPEEVHALHEAAHALCFIANSVTTAIRIEPAGEEAL